jgi:hypothetical protein
MGSVLQFPRLSAPTGIVPLSAPPGRPQVPANQILAVPALHRRMLARALNAERAAGASSGNGSSRPWLRVVHEADPSRAGRLVIAGTMAAVCAELERLSQMEAA